VPSPPSPGRIGVPDHPMFRGPLLGPSLGALCLSRQCVIPNVPPAASATITTRPNRERGPWDRHRTSQTLTTVPAHPSRRDLISGLLSGPARPESPSLLATRKTHQQVLPRHRRQPAARRGQLRSPSPRRTWDRPVKPTLRTPSRQAGPGRRPDDDHRPPPFQAYSQIHRLPVPVVLRVDAPTGAASLQADPRSAPRLGALALLRWSSRRPRFGWTRAAPSVPRPAGRGGAQRFSAAGRKSEVRKEQL